MPGNPSVLTLSELPPWRPGVFVGHPRAYYSQFWG